MASSLVVTPTQQNTALAIAALVAAVAAVGTTIWMLAMLNTAINS